MQTNIKDKQEKIDKFNNNIKILSSSRRNNITYCKCICEKCGFEFEKPWSNLIHGVGCNKCNKKYKMTLEEAKDEFLKYGYIFLDDKYSNINTRYNIQTIEGYKSKISYASLKRGCKATIFSSSNPHTINNIKLWIKLNNKSYELISNTYVRQKSKLEFKCSCGNIFEITLDDLLAGKGDKGCKECYLKSLKGESHPMWKGGITPLSNYLRKHISEWKKDSLEKYNNRCVITGKTTSIVHHLIGFSELVNKTLEITNMELHENISYYTEEELDTIKDVCLELHYKNGLGVPLDEEVHKLFHHIYGYGNNTKEQFEEFKKTYTTKSA